MPHISIAAGKLINLPACALVSLCGFPLLGSSSVRSRPRDLDCVMRMETSRFFRMANTDAATAPEPDPSCSGRPDSFFSSFAHRFTLQAASLLLD